ncbi:uncharacterized protein LOC134787169 [Penaeus indicus]|uniref:uncharacterized protein LOC134787169 n=1 Tax=Penaeus indicus TaxID=29960 RepID=UPI00300CFC76
MEKQAVGHVPGIQHRIITMTDTPVHFIASTQAVVGALLQHNAEGIPHTIAYWSRTQENAETRYAVIDLETLAVVEAVRVFDQYIDVFLVWTDHQPLVEVLSNYMKSTRLSWYVYELGGYDFVLKYKTGQMRAVQLMEHQLQDPACEDLLEECRSVPGERPAALS